MHSLALQAELHILMHTKSCTKTVISHALRETNTRGYSLTIRVLALRLHFLCWAWLQVTHDTPMGLSCFYSAPRLFSCIVIIGWLQDTNSRYRKPTLGKEMYGTGLHAHFPLTETIANGIPHRRAPARAACRFASDLTGELFHSGIWLPEASLKYWWMMLSDTYGLNMISQRHLFCWKLDKQ